MNYFVLVCDMKIRGGMWNMMCNEFNKNIEQLKTNYKKASLHFFWLFIVSLNNEINFVLSAAAFDVSRFPRLKLNVIVKHAPHFLLLFPINFPQSLDQKSISSRYLFEGSF